jgi:hypothetical protein
MIDHDHFYAATGAIHAAGVLGLDIGRAGGRRMFLAITDAVCGEMTHIGITARHVGDTRTAERWRIHTGSDAVDALYDPGTATIVSLVVAPR